MRILSLVALAASAAALAPLARRARPLPPLRAAPGDNKDAAAVDGDPFAAPVKAPVEGSKVRMFGARLDAGLAGPRASDRSTIRRVLAEYRAGNSTEGLASNDAQAEIFYGAAVDAMNRGRYDDSVRLLNRACYFAGVASRRGGQMQLWLAQALYAANRRGECLKLLQALKAHPDSDVRKVGKELLYILKAPQLKLDDESFVNIDMDAFDAGRDAIVFSVTSTCV